LSYSRIGGGILRFVVLLGISGGGCVGCVGCEEVVAVEVSGYCEEEDRAVCIVFLFAAGKDDFDGEVGTNMGVGTGLGLSNTLRFLAASPPISVVASLRSVSASPSNSTGSSTPE